tara:strand:+ start:1061 stop:2440 length:1380 start_codon:yes stop_codon:yes gene_type:complete
MSGPMMLMLGASGGGAGGWILELNPGFSNTTGYATTVTSSDGTDSGNMYVAIGSGTYTEGVAFVKFDKNGNILDDKKVASSDINDVLAYPQIAVDSSENIYMVTYQWTGQQSMMVLKLNSSFSLSEQPYYNFSNANTGSYFSIAASGSNVYLNTFFDIYPGTRPTGFILNGSNMNVSSAHSYFGVDDNRHRVLKIFSNNIYVGGNFRMGSSSDRFTVMKFGTDFSSVSLSRGYDTKTGYCNDLDVDGSGNIYAIGFVDLAYPNTRDNLVTKLNSSGTAQWRKSIRLQGDNNTNGFIGGAGTQTGMAIKKTSEGVVAVHFDNKNVNGTNNDVNISLMSDSNGGLIESYGIACTSSNWQQSYGTAQMGALITDTHAYIQVKANGKFYILKLPIKDGADIYGNYTLNSVNFTIGANSAADVDAESYDFSTTSTSPSSRTINKTNQSDKSASAITVTSSKVDI